MKRHLSFIAALMLAGVTVPAAAQGYYERTYSPEGPVHWHLAMGYTPTVGQTTQYFQGGWSFGGGFTWRPDRSPLALRADIDYSRFDATRHLIALNELADQIEIDNGYGEVVGLNVDGEYRVRLGPATAGFALAGVGVNHLRIALTQTVAVGSYVCDPWFGGCTFGLAPGDIVVASADSTRFSWNAGLGLDFALRNGQTFFLEARYLRVETTQPTEFVPITLGLRF